MHGTSHSRFLCAMHFEMDHLYQDRSNPSEDDVTIGKSAGTNNTSRCVVCIEMAI